jgi:hypothetical protein
VTVLDSYNVLVEVNFVVLVPTRLVSATVLSEDETAGASVVVNPEFSSTEVVPGTTDDSETGVEV